MIPPALSTRLAATPAEIRAAQRLRYRVFVEELGGDGPLVDHEARLERDVFDDDCEHLLLLDGTDGDEVVGVYRLMDAAGAERAGGFYTAREFDLAPLLRSGRPALELGRSCLHPDHRGGAALQLMWRALAELVVDRGIEILFGVASFHGTDPEPLAAPLSLLRARHLAPPALRIRARDPNATPMDLTDPADIDRVAAMAAVPPLIKSYLRLGGFVGEGAWIDREFNTIDVGLVLDIAQVPEDRLAPLLGARMR